MSRLLVAGPGRSGTTWVAEALSLAAGAVHVQEPDSPDLSPYAVIGGRGLGTAPALGPEQAAPAFELLWRVAFAGGWPAPHLLLRAYYRWRPALGRLLDSRLGVTVGEALARALLAGRRPAPRVLVKTVDSLFCLDWIVSRFQPRVVLVRRHPLSVIASRLELGWEPPPGHGSRLTRTAWEVGLQLRALRSAAERHPDWRVVSHEWLCQDPPGRFRALCDELGLPWSQAAQNYLVRSDRPGRGYQMTRLSREQLYRPWRNRLSPAEVEEALNMLRSLGLAVTAGESSPDGA